MLCSQSSLTNTLKNIYAGPGNFFFKLYRLLFLSFTLLQFYMSLFLSFLCALLYVLRGFLSWHNRWDLLVPFRWRGFGLGVVVALVSVFVDGAPVLLRWLCYICSRGWAFIKFVQVFCLLCVVWVFDCRLSTLLCGRNLCSQGGRVVSVFASCTPPGALLSTWLQRVPGAARSEKSVALSIPLEWSMLTLGLEPI